MRILFYSMPTQLLLGRNKKMKRDINLIQKRSADSKTAKGILYFMLGLVILGGLYYFATTIPGIIKNNALMEKTALEKKLETLSKTQQEFDEGTKKKKLILENIGMLEELENNKKDLYGLVDFVEKSCPHNVIITNIKFSPDILEVDGLAGSDTDISNFLINLRKNKEFASVIANKTDINAQLQKQNYIISMQFAEPLPAEPLAPEKKEEKDAGKTGGETAAP